MVLFNNEELMTELELITKQRDIFLNALKTIATNKRTPDWISKYCRNEVTKARELKQNESGDDKDILTKEQILSAPFEPGDLVRNYDEKDKCVYQIVRLSTTIDGVNLWDLRIIKGDDKNPVNHIVPNVPENKFHK